MRFVPVALAAVLGLAAASTAVHGQKPDAQVDARSLALLDQAKVARTSGNLDQATDLLETALAVDPKNRRAFHELAEIAKAQGLPGKAIRFYREALTLEPNDQAALRGQGEAMVQKGAVERAKENLARLKTLCGNCADATQLAAAIAKGPPATATAQIVPAPKADEKKN